MRGKKSTISVDESVQSTVQLFLKVRRQLDRSVCEGYAAENTPLVGALVMTCGIELATNALSKQFDEFIRLYIKSHSEKLGSDETKLTNELLKNWKRKNKDHSPEQQLEARELVVDVIRKLRRAA